MKNYKFELSYDGTRYYGWEKQPNVETIQGKLEAVLSKMTQKPVEVLGAGRTDAGVHARAMIASVHMETEKTPEEILAYMNRYLPEDICVNDVKIASDRFHARYSAVGKLYVYTCYSGVLKPVFNRKYVTVLDYQPDAAKMREAAAFLQGEHDFTSFCGNTHMKKSAIRVIDSIEIVEKRGYITFRFHGTGFLQNQVRIMVGTLLEIGRGKIEAAEMKRILEGRDRKLSGPVAPARGLVLERVDY
ncbi:MAG: tRNA pseudouridine(38-40) synthase TruA [Lachnospiraceae bacterium]|nr:tRNA pseudouridine(38-40) synthase TruA [Lachnospiraceae bacterium]MBR0086805.1 tRNA pseudouridine(38-40) synthase TruA [Lachnospiraceae bacterium]